jgi:hypothetical protein
MKRDMKVPIYCLCSFHTNYTCVFRNDEIFKKQKFMKENREPFLIIWNFFTWNFQNKIMIQHKIVEFVMCVMLVV